MQLIQWTNAPHIHMHLRGWCRWALNPGQRGGWFQVCGRLEGLIAELIVASSLNRSLALLVYSIVYSLTA
jgi:hypothetical protein